MSDIPKLWERAEPVPYSSVVGQSVLLFHESGKVTCQLSLVGCPLDRAGQEWLAQMLCDALNAYQSDAELSKARSLNAELVEALKAARGALDTPIARRKLDLIGNPFYRETVDLIRAVLSRAKEDT